MGDQGAHKAGIQAEQPQVVEEPNEAGAHPASTSHASSSRRSCAAAHGSTDTHSELPSSTT